MIYSSCLEASFPSRQTTPAWHWWCWCKNQFTQASLYRLKCHTQSMLLLPYTIHSIGGRYDKRRVHVYLYICVCVCVQIHILIRTYLTGKRHGVGLNELERLIKRYRNKNTEIKWAQNESQNSDGLFKCCKKYFTTLDKMTAETALDIQLEYFFVGDFFFFINRKTWIGQMFWAWQSALSACVCINILQWNFTGLQVNFSWKNHFLTISIQS